MNSLLAIAAASFDKPSETFIRNHVRMIAPGETVLLCQDGSGAEQFDCPVLSGVTFHRPAGSNRDLPARTLRYLWRTFVDRGLWAEDRRRVLAFLRTHRPRALLAEYGTTGCLFLRTCEEAEVPLYVHFHGYDANVLPATPFMSRHYKRLFDRAESIIVTTEFLKQRLLALGCPETKLSICPCGVDTQLFSPGQGQYGTKSILMVSRLIPQKGPLPSLRSFALLATRHPDATLEVIGDGPLRADMEVEAKRLGVSARVNFYGARPHEFVCSRLRAARMLIQHCVSLPNGGVESLGLSILEAMACELPVVSTRHGAIPENVKHGVTGLLVDEHDVDGMAAAMATLLDDPERAAVMGAAGRQRVLEHYTLDHARDRLRAIMGFAPFTPSQHTTATTAP